MKAKSGSSYYNEASTVLNCDFDNSADDRPKTEKMQPSNECCGNTDSEKNLGNVLSNPFILWIPQLNILAHMSNVTPVFGFPNEYVFTGQGLKQKDWTKRGLYINFEYLGDGWANLLVAITRRDTREQYLRVLDRLSKKAHYVQSEGVH